MIIKRTASNYFQSINPFTLETIGNYDIMKNSFTELKLDNAAKAYATWKNESLTHRIELILKVHDYLLENVDMIAWFITTEMGKTITESKAEVEKCALLCKYYCENAEEFLQNEKVKSDIQHYISYHPIGGILGVMPWNFPFWQVFRAAIGVIISGNVFILKHAPNVSGCALEIENIFAKCGFEKGIFTTLIVEVEQLKTILKHPLIKGVTLTGSEKAGKSFAALAGKFLLKPVLELGGSDAFIFLDDADFVAGAREGIKSRMQNAGQSCASAKRFLVTSKNYDLLVDLMSQSCAKIILGNPMDTATQMGPMARKDLVQNLAKQQAQAIMVGSVIAFGGSHTDNNYQPTLLINNTLRTKVFRDETFGPLACIFVAENEQNLIELANKSNYGLGASIWTKDIDKGKKIAEKLEVGNVYINKMVKSDPSLPFGGIKNSGYGKELALEGIRTFMNAKTIVF
jgi:succinate-semialdehyde dehydrogenase / glutarate-semialdehyde dehydrogenase